MKLVYKNDQYEIWQSEVNEKVYAVYNLVGCSCCGNDTQCCDPDQWKKINSFVSSKTIEEIVEDLEANRIEFKIPKMIYPKYEYEVESNYYKILRGY